MFKSLRRSIVVPQSEHLRLVGAMAMLYGNPGFEVPPVPRASIVLGMSSHDRGYGVLDNSPIGGMQPEEWNVIARRGFYMQYSDIIADTIVKYHVRRLARNDETDERRAMTMEFTRAIDLQLGQNNLSKDTFDRLDRITELTDRISYDFCFEQPSSKEVVVFPANGSPREISVKLHVVDGVINAHPWPFSVESYEGYITGYALDGYPERLDPVVLPWKLEKRAA